MVDMIDKILFYSFGLILIVLVSISVSCKKKYVLLDEYATIKYNDISIATKEDLNCIFFLNEKIGFVGGENGAFFKTVDGGMNWLDISLKGNESIKSISFINQNKGFLAAGGAGLLKTIDGGTNWTTELIAYAHSDISFLGDSIGYTVANYGSRGKMYKTTDGGNFWFELTLVTWPAIMGTLKDVAVFNNNNAFAVGSRGVSISTNNGGATWSGYFNGVSTDVSLNDVKYSTTGDYYIVGNEGTFSGSGSWTSYISDIEYNIHAIDFNGKKVLLLVIVVFIGI